MAAPAMILACLLAHSGVAVGSVQPTATWQCRWGRMVGVKHVSLHWGLNPGPSACKPDALPLRYRGICRKYLRPQQFPNTLPTPKNPRSLPKGPAIGSRRRRRPFLHQHLRLHSARLAGGFLGCSWVESDFEKLLGRGWLVNSPGCEADALKMKQSQFARIVKRVDLRYSGGNSVWVRDLRFALKFCVINDEGRR